MEEPNELIPGIELHDSPYMKAAKSIIYRYKVSQGKPNYPRQRLEGLREALRYAIAQEKNPSQASRLSEDLEKISIRVDECKADVVAYRQSRDKEALQL